MTYPFPDDALVSLPSVTIVTSTWQRPQTLLRGAIASVNDQDYAGPLQHLVVIDGLDTATESVLRESGYSGDGLADRRFVALGRNWSSYSGDGGFGATCRMVGSWLATGDLVSYLDDDQLYYRTYVSTMVGTFDPDTDFVTCSWTGVNAGASNAQSPGRCRTDTSSIMHRALVLKSAGGFAPDGYEGDGKMVERWMEKGLRWKYQPEKLFHYTGAHMGAPLG